MRLNDFSVRVVNGHEVAGGYVEMAHGAKYTLCLHNYRNVVCDTQVSIDGKDVGTWRISAHSSIRLERPAHDTGRFTFYELGTEDAEAAQIPSGADSGLVRVTFTPACRMVWYYTNTVVGECYPDSPQGYCYTYDPPQYCYLDQNLQFFIDGGSRLTTDNVACSLSTAKQTSQPAQHKAGGTGLSGQSGQEFGTASSISLDYSQRTTIHLRLVGGRGNDSPRPLTQLSTPIPPSVK